MATATIEKKTVYGDVTLVLSLEEADLVQSYLQTAMFHRRDGYAPNNKSVVTVIQNTIRGLVIEAQTTMNGD